MTVRIGLIGAGIMGSDHARIFATQIPGVTLQYICDADANRLKTIANETGAKNTAADPLAVIGSKDVDAIVIASPDETHAPLTLAAITLGKPVLCEKPLSPSSAECLNVIALETKIGKRLAQIGFMRRFDPSYVEMKSVLKSDALGAPLMMHNFHRNVSAPSNFTGQMAISNSAPHEFDIARWVLDTEYKSINVFRPKLADPTKTGAPVFMVLETVAGQLVNIEINNNAAYGYDVRGELVGEKGTVSLQNNDHSLTRVNSKQSINFPADWRPRFADAYRLQNAAWINSIQTGVPAGASAWDGYAATLVAEAGVQSLLQNKPIMVSSVTKPKLY
jgi:myo-inositol 2-dehydrogenase / D-chiro-inositol 1-dehydrogenase